ncbi:MAG: NAD(P)/FAD-dependent oxidoreductase [Methylococcaceae bacterium]|jgi:predicted NAD/FAD-binding protein
MRIAIVGSGISGLVAAFKLSGRHDITVYEAADRIGGHTHTHEIPLAGKIWSVDTGFIVFNDWTYPNFIRLLDELGIQSSASSMSFSVRCDTSGLEYNGTSLNTLFAQRRNLLRPSFLRMVRDILRFNREAPAVLDTPTDQLQLKDYLQAGRYGREFRDHYIIPMGAAIWSAAPEEMLKFPARYFIRFFHNHGMLSVDQRPQWRVVAGGSSRYIEPLSASFRDGIRLATPVARIVREAGGVTIMPQSGEAERHDAVVLACHSDQALALLDEPTPLEREILGAIPYQENEAILHTDTRILPKSKRAWAAWNYHIPAQVQDRVAVTYNMNILQGLAAPETFCVSLNPSAAIDPGRILQRMTYHHPVYTPAGILAQSRHAEISGSNRTYYCGAYWGFGFHEDGVTSGLRVADQINGCH